LCRVGRSPHAGRLPNRPPDFGLSPATAHHPHPPTTNQQTSTSTSPCSLHQFTSRHCYLALTSCSVAWTRTSSPRRSPHAHRRRIHGMLPSPGPARSRRGSGRGGRWQARPASLPTSPHVVATATAKPVGVRPSPQGREDAALSISLQTCPCLTQLPPASPPSAAVT
jgi:hypothetical protein